MTSHSERFGEGLEIVAVLCTLGGIIAAAVAVLWVVWTAVVAPNLRASALVAGIVGGFIIVTYLIGYAATDLGDDARRWLE